MAGLPLAAYPVEAQISSASVTSTVPLAPAVKGSRPRVNPKQVKPAATQLAPAIRDLGSPELLALPTKAEMVRIQELRPLGLAEVTNLAEVNNPNLKAIASQVDQAKSNLRAQLALWYPTLSVQAATLPGYTYGKSSADFAGGGSSQTNIAKSAVAAGALLEYALINPQRVPLVAAARDQYERAKYGYLVSLRELRLQAAQAYFDLQQSDDEVRIGQESVRASLVSLRDARARFQAGVATKLEVLQAETQLARDQQLLANSLAAQSIARRSLAALLDLPFGVTPTAKEPARVLGVWNASLSESIVAAYSFREELDQAILDISISNSQANAALGGVQPILKIFTGADYGQFNGGQGNQSSSSSPISGNEYTNSYGLKFTWSIFDGGAAAAQSRQSKQQAQEGRYKFSQRRDQIRQEVETSFYELQKNNRNIITTSREVISARESLRLARLRFQAGVTTQREVVDTQRDLTQAEVRYSSSISDYNKRLVEISRRTGLNQVSGCAVQALSAVKPAGVSDVPVDPTPLIPACRAAAPGAVF
ncbi:TolC family protein [Cyanobium sp. HWJ4-Hawea]|nr:TolC family protein [Cyanobium sp. HWJ4-Hawea]